MEYNSPACHYNTGPETFTCLALVQGEALPKQSNLVCLNLSVLVCIQCFRFPSSGLVEMNLTRTLEYAMNECVRSNKGFVVRPLKH